MVGLSPFGDTDAGSIETGLSCFLAVYNHQVYNPVFVRPSFDLELSVAGDEA
jgi:hypothetical protein